EAANPEIERVELTVEVAIKTSRLARIRLQDGDDVVPQHALDTQLHRRDVHPLLETLGRHGIVIARHIAADIVPMADRGEETEQFAVSEIGPHELEIGKMRAA